MSPRTWGHPVPHHAAGLLAGPEEELQQKDAQGKHEARMD